MSTHSGTGLRVNTGAASAANRNFYGLRRIADGELMPLGRAFGSITRALDFLFSLSSVDPEAWETVDLRRDVAAREQLRALGTKGLPR